MQQGAHADEPDTHGLGLARQHGPSFPSQQAGREKGEARRRGDDLFGDLPVHQVAQRVLVGADFERWAEAGQQRGMAERLSLAQEVEHPALIQQLDGPGPNHVKEPGRLARLLEDHRTGREELDLDRPGDPLELLEGKGVERRVPGEERLDLHHGVSHCRVGELRPG